MLLDFLEKSRPQIVFKKNSNSSLFFSFSFSLSRLVNKQWQGDQSASRTQKWMSHTRCSPTRKEEANTQNWPPSSFPCQFIEHQQQQKRRQRSSGE
jgi:hypothetical protein